MPPRLTRVALEPLHAHSDSVPYDHQHYPYAGTGRELLPVLYCRGELGGVGLSICRGHPEDESESFRLSIAAHGQRWQRTWRERDL